MKWFIELEEKIRIAITAAAWGLFVIVALVINSATEGNTDGMSGGQVFIILLLLAVAIVFTVLTARTHDKEKKAEKEKAAQAQAEAEAKRRAELREKIGDVGNVDDIKVGKVAEFAATPSRIIKLVKNGNEEMQSNISYCNVGEDCTVEFDYEKNLYLCVSDGVDVGFFPEGVIEELAGRGQFAIKINDITTNSNDKYVIKVGIHLPVDASEDSVNFPIHTKARGVTFGGRQEYLRDSEEGDALIIKHAPTPEYPDTIAIINERTGKQLGNVGADLAASLLGEFGEGCSFHGIIQEITGGEDDKKTLGCNFTIEGVE